jgi:hypothetical protein
MGDMHDMMLEKSFRDIANQNQNPLLRAGFSFFSQVDEDGITLEILKRIGSRREKQAGSFVELGVGDGTENNTLVLAAMGWKGFWFGGEDVDRSIIGSFTGRLKFFKCWVTKETLAQEILPHVQAIDDLDVFSLDLDGNDWYFCEQILNAGVRPKLWIQEYNGNFPPEVDWCIPYDENHRWEENIYFGASLLAYTSLFKKYGYKLIACNVTGVNAFFVREEFVSSFSDVPISDSELFMPSRPWLYKARQKRDPKMLLGFR